MANWAEFRVEQMKALIAEREAGLKDRSLTWYRGEEDAHRSFADYEALNDGCPLSVSIAALKYYLIFWERMVAQVALDGEEAFHDEASRR